MTRGPDRLEAGGAKLAGFGALALVNQAVLLTLNSQASFGTKALHRAYDLGQLVALGVLSLAGVTLSRRVLARAPRFGSSLVVRFLLSAVAVALVSALVVEDDVTNAAGRYDVPVWFAMLSASLTFGVLLGATVLLCAVPLRAVRALAVLTGIACAVGNAFVLPGDYPALHLMIGWLGALLIAHGIEGLPLPVAVPARARRLGLALLAVTSLATLVVPPPQAVLHRLLSLPSAIAAPFVARLMPDRLQVSSGAAPRKLRGSPWFQSRKALSPLPPSGALPLPDDRLVILLTIDATRADVLSNPEHRKKLPVLSALMQEAAWFSQARAPASSTRPSMASIFTGRYYAQLHFTTKKGQSFLDDDGPRFPRLLTRARVSTVSLPLFGRISRASGVGRGFRTELAGLGSARATVTKLIELVKDASGPTFLYAHFGEPHAPYRGAGTPFERYLADIGVVDKELGRLLAVLDRPDFSRRTVLFVSADHGEAFMEHGVGNHATIVYEEVARIPLLVRGPGVVPREIKEWVSGIDLGPTILDLFGLPSPGPFMGQTLAPLLAGGSQKLERAIAIQATHGLQALYVGRHKVIVDIHSHTVEVYDLSTDPGEKVNLVDSGTKAVAEAIETAELFAQAHGRVKRSFDLGGD